MVVFFPSSVSFCLPHDVAFSAFMICSGLCAFVSILAVCVCVCVLYVGLG